MKRTFSRFSFLLLAAFFVFSSVGCDLLTNTSGSEECRPAFSIVNQDPDVYSFEFLAVGDAGTGDLRQKTVAGAMENYAGKNPVRFVLYLGDNFYPNGVDSVDDPKFRTYFEEIYDKTLLNIPFYAVLGNHDYRRNPYAQAAYTFRSSRWHMPNFYYTFTVDHNESILCQFIALDTTPIDKWDRFATQLNWLEDVLSKSSAHWKIVFGHHTIFSNGKHGDTEDMIDEVLPILERYNVDLYICGHDHDLQVLQQQDGVNFLVSGAGASPRVTNCGENTIYAAGRLGFMALRVSYDEIVVSVVLHTGEIDFSHTIPKQMVSATY